MMPSYRNRMIAQEKKDTIKMLENLLKMLRSGEYVVVNKGSWDARMDGKICYKIDVIPFDRIRQDSD